MAETIPIPEPPGLPLIGNMREFVGDASNRTGIIRLANTLGS